jgi:hypothetical protein
MAAVHPGALATGPYRKKKKKNKKKNKTCTVLTIQNFKKIYSWYQL